MRKLCSDFLLIEKISYINIINIGYAVDKKNLSEFEKIKKYNTECYL